MRILCIIPARSGSKGIKDKNIKEMNGKPLILYSIDQALNSREYKNGNMRVIVSTDSERYKEIVERYCEVIIRPDNISGDLSSDIEFMRHVVESIDERYDVILHLRPTQPLRRVSDIDKCLSIFSDNYEMYDSLRSVIELKKSPYKMYKKEGDRLVPYFRELKLKESIIIEPYNRARQLLPRSYLHNGYIDILKVSLLDIGRISGDNIYAYVMEEGDSIDIDDMSDWEECERRLR